jgi:LmbE family N-acetylglucosaminyl deacetylase
MPCGGTIAKFRDGKAEVRVLFLAEGVTARYSLEELETAKVKNESRLRNDNAFKALAVLGVEADSIFVNARYCCRLDQVPQIDLAKEIEGHVRAFEPSQLLTHWGHDVNIDHRLTHQAVLSAVRPAACPSLRRVMAFEVLSSSEWNTTSAFQANAFQDVSAQIDRKLEAMAAYGDEMRAPPHPRSAEVIRALARFRGAQAGVAYAEGFNLIRSLDA